MIPIHSFFSFFFFNDTATTEIYTLSLHDALPISKKSVYAICILTAILLGAFIFSDHVVSAQSAFSRSEEHTSELQSLTNLVCRLLLEKKKKNNKSTKKSQKNMKRETRKSKYMNIE